jgi:hypothetical protein
MPVLLCGVGLLLLAFLAQVAIWRLSLPKSQTRALLVLFALIPPFVFGIAWATQHPIVLSAAELARVGVLYVSCALAYIVLYSAIEMQSPTLAIVSHLAAGGSAGSTDDDLFARFGRDDTLRSRILAIEQGGWVCRTGDVIMLTPSGRFYAGLFDRGSTIVGLGLTKGG